MCFAANLGGFHKSVHMRVWVKNDVNFARIGDPNIACTKKWKPPNLAAKHISVLWTFGEATDTPPTNYE